MTDKILIDNYTLDIENILTAANTKIEELITLLPETGIGKVPGPTNTIFLSIVLLIIHFC